MTTAAPDAAPTQRRRSPPKPFTLPHFRAWTRDLILDTGESWGLEPFQIALAEDIFKGYREIWFVVPEGNGKTTFTAGFALYHAEFRPMASVPVAASSRDQAEILYRQAEGFVIRSERLHEPVHSAVAIAKGKRKTEVPRFQCLEGYRRINFHGGSRIQIFAADENTGDGAIPTLGIIDELHRHKTLGLYRTWAGKLDKRGGQLVTISTAGEFGSDFELTRKRIRTTATSITRKGSFTRAASDQIVMHEYAVPDGADVTDMRVVKAANPFSAITVASLRAKFGRATMTMPHWLRLTCNRTTRSESAAIQEAEWLGALEASGIPEGVPIWLGLDVAWKWDTTAAVPLWWDTPKHRVLGVPEILVPPRDGTSLDPHLVESALLRLHARNPIHTVVMDISRAEQLAAWITENLGAEVIERPTSNTFAVQDYDRFMEALRQGWLKHAGDPGLTTHALNAIARELPGGDIRFDRPSQTRDGGDQERRVIDALTAAAAVNAQAAIPPDIEPEPVYFYPTT